MVILFKEGHSRNLFLQKPQLSGSGWNQIDIQILDEVLIVDELTGFQTKRNHVLIVNFIRGVNSFILLLAVGDNTQLLYEILSLYTEDE